MGFVLSERYRRVRRKRVSASTRAKRKRAYLRRKSKIRRRAKKYRKSSKAKRAKRIYKKYRKTHKGRKGTRLVRSDSEIDRLAQPILEVIDYLLNEGMSDSAMLMLEETSDIIEKFEVGEMKEQDAIKHLTNLGRRLIYTLKESV